MELLNESEINIIAKKCGFTKVLNWTYEELEDKIVGYLGDHLNLKINVESDGFISTLKLFVKCMPRYDIWKAEYIRELLFFKKEYVMLSQLFNEFDNTEDSRKWRPKLLYIKEDVFVFENVILQGYEMALYQKTLSYAQITAVIATLARFHSQSYVYEERKSKELGRPYRIWEQYSDYLQEPQRGLDWRDTGAKAVIDVIKVFSKHRSKPNFDQKVESVIPSLYKRAIELMKPSSEYRNVVVHRDLWANNLFLKMEADSSYHAMFVDFQTVIYCSPMLDLSSFIYFNTSLKSRTIWKDKFIDCYYSVLSEELKAAGVCVEDIITKDILVEAYEKSIVFGLTQAGLIVPIGSMNKDKREEIFYNPETCEKVNNVSRSEEFISVAKQDDKYRNRLIDLFDEIVERFVL